MIIGLVSWAGLFVTITGFGIALAQLQRVKSAAFAAQAAVATMTAAVRQQEQSFKIAGALDAFRLADEYLRTPNRDAAAAYLFAGWTALLEARELTAGSDDYGQIEQFAAAVRLMYDEVRAPDIDQALAARTQAERYLALSKVLDGLGQLSARLRIRLSGIGVVVK